MNDYTIRNLPYDSLANVRVNLAAADDTAFLKDSNGVMLFAYRGDTTYHPVSMANRMNYLLAAYKHTRDQKYYLICEAYLKRFRDIGMRVGNRVYFPYMFRFALHGDSANIFTPPWYSGMAQGLILGCVLRFVEQSNDSSYLPFADSVFNTFKALRGNSEPWTVRKDDSGFYWVEEYPLENPDMTLNGFIEGLSGVYDYYRVTKNKDALDILKASLTTLHHYAPEFLANDTGSFYCLAHHMPANRGYHVFHGQLYRQLERYSGDPWFGLIAEIFEKRDFK